MKLGDIITVPTDLDDPDGLESAAIVTRVHEDGLIELLVFGTGGDPATVRNIEPEADPEPAAPAPVASSSSDASTVATSDAYSAPAPATSPAAGVAAPPTTDVTAPALTTQERIAELEAEIAQLQAEDAAAGPHAGTTPADTPTA